MRDTELFERHVLRRVEHGERGEERELQVVELCGRLGDEVDQAAW